MQDTAAAPTSDAATRQKYYDTIAPQSLAPLWEVLKGLVPPEPRSKAVAARLALFQGPSAAARSRQAR